MKATLLIILTASICLLHTGADITNVPVYPDLDVQKLAGTWYPIVGVLKNREPLNTIIFEHVVEPLDEEDLVLKIRYIQNGACYVTHVHVVHTNKPGVFKVPATTEIICMVDVDYENYHTVHVVLNNSHSLYLLSRTREASEEVKTKFRELASTLGFDVNQIISTRLADSCP